MEGKKFNLREQFNELYDISNELIKKKLMKVEKEIKRIERQKKLEKINN